MSTKVHHGYRIDLSGADDGATDLFTFTGRLRAALNPVRDLVDATWLMNHAIHEIDLADRKGEERSAMPLMDAMLAYDKEQDAENAKGYRQAQASHRFDPHRFEVAFALDTPEATGHEAGTGWLLARIFCEEPALIATWEGMSEVEPFPFWDNADRPDGVTEEQWSERGAAYRRTNPDAAPVGDHSLTFQLRSPSMDIGMMMLAHSRQDFADDQARVELLRDVAPTMSDRVRSRVTDLLVFEVLGRITCIEDRGEAARAAGTSKMISLVRRYGRPSDTLRALPEWGALLAAVEATLDPDAVEWAIHGTDNLDATLRQMGLSTGGADEPEPMLAFAADMTAADAAARALLDAEERLASADEDDDEAQESL